MTEAGQKVQKVQMVQGRGQKVQERLSKLDRPSLSFDHGADGAEGAEGAGKFNQKGLPKTRARSVPHRRPQLTSRTRETVLNVWLAEELRKRGLDAKEESAQTGNRAIDVETVHTIRRSLAAEPSVIGKRYTGSSAREPFPLP